MIITGTLLQRKWIQSRRFLPYCKADSVIGVSGILRRVLFCSESFTLCRWHRESLTGISKPSSVILLLALYLLILTLSFYFPGGIKSIDDEFMRMSSFMETFSILIFLMLFLIHIFSCSLFISILEQN